MTSQARRISPNISKCTFSRAPLGEIFAFFLRQIIHLGVACAELAKEEAGEVVFVDIAKFSVKSEAKCVFQALRWWVGVPNSTPTREVTTFLWKSGSDSRICSLGA